MKLNYYIYSLIACVLLMVNACTPDEFALGDMDLTSDDLVEGIAYSITHDEENPNIIYLKSLLGNSYTALWEHPQGRSQGAEVTLQIAFAGTYSVTFGVETRGGVVYGEPTTFTIDDFCADFVSDDLWTYLSGGVGSSKKWFLDIDANGVSRYFSGPLYFYGTDDSWDTVSGGATVDGDSWSWGASFSDVAGWQFSSTAMDFGYMEFDLIDGSNVTVVMNDLNKTMTGVYMLDATNHTLTLTDAELLHDAVNDSQVASWSGTLKLLSLTENTMQVAVERTSDPCLLSFNFISEDYYNSWSPSVDNNVVPTLADDWRDYVEPKTNQIITYKLSEETPFDWCNLDGSLKGITSSVAISGIEDLTLVLNSRDATYSVTTPSGIEVTGTYTLSSDGIYTFSNGLPEVVLSTDGKAVFKLGADNTLRIMQYETDSDYSGALTDLWLGGSETDDFGTRYQYIGYHFVPESGSSTEQYAASMHFFDVGWSFQDSSTIYVTGDGTYTLTISGSSSSPYGLYLDISKILNSYPNMDVVITNIKVDGSSISFDDNMIERVQGDDASTARRYILNPWGNTAGDASKYVFSSSIEVTFNVTLDNGTPFITE